MAHHFDLERHHRRSIRLKGYDYTLAGAYFVTLVTHERAGLFGEVMEGAVRLSAAGEVAQAAWGAIPDHFPAVMLGEYVVMPNHVHGIIMLTTSNRRGEEAGAPISPQGINPGPASSPLPPTMPRGTRPGSLSAIVQAFKAESTRRINRVRGVAGSGMHVWQRNFHERIIRNEREHDALAAYVWNNPAQWAADRENPAVAGA